jgi:hypothetical protein
MTPTSEVATHPVIHPVIHPAAEPAEPGGRLLAALRPKVAMLTELELGAVDRETALAALSDFCAGPVRRHLAATDRAFYAPAADVPVTRLLVRALRTSAAALAQDIDVLTRMDDPRRARAVARSIEVRLATQLAVEQAVLLPALAALPVAGAEAGPRPGAAPPRP